MDKTKIYVVVDKNTNDYRLTKTGKPLLVGRNFTIDSTGEEKLTVEAYEDKFGALTPSFARRDN